MQAFELRADFISASIFLSRELWPREGSVFTCGLLVAWQNFNLHLWLARGFVFEFLRQSADLHERIMRVIKAVPQAHNIQFLLIHRFLQHLSVFVWYYETWQFYTKEHYSEIALLFGNVWMWRSSVSVRCYFYVQSCYWFVASAQCSSSFFGVPTFSAFCC